MNGQGNKQSCTLDLIGQKGFCCETITVKKHGNNGTEMYAIYLGEQTKIVALYSLEHVLIYYVLNI